MSSLDVLLLGAVHGRGVPIMHTLPSMLPTGWFQVAWGVDLAVAEVVPMHYFGRDLVAFRQLDGVVKVLDTHCQHLGASLARRLPQRHRRSASPAV